MAGLLCAAPRQAMTAANTNSAHIRRTRTAGCKTNRAIGRKPFMRRCAPAGNAEKDELPVMPASMQLRNLLLLQGGPGIYDPVPAQNIMYRSEPESRRSERYFQK